MTITPVSFDVFTSHEIGLLTGLLPDELISSNEDEAQVDLLTCYLHEIGKYSLLKEPEERHLATRVAEGDEDARTHLIEANLRLVVSIAKRYRGLGLSFLDLISYGNLGLLQAVEKFDAHKGYRFTTYASWWIRQAITRSLDQYSRTIRKPSYLITALRRLLQQEHDLMQQLGRHPLIHELAAYTGKRLEVVEHMLTTDRPMLSLETLLGNAQDLPLQDLLTDERASDPLQFACEQEWSATIRPEVKAMLSSLTPRERAVVTLHFGFDGSGERGLAQIGRELGMCRERARQLLSSALDKMRTSEHAQVIGRALLDRHAS